MKLNPLPTQERLRELFDYSDAEYELRGIKYVGGLIWRHRRDAWGRANTALVGRFAGAPGKRQRIRVAVDGQHYELNRLVWVWHHGRCEAFVDHASRDDHDNRISNLREATSAQNNANRTINDRASSKFVGVYFDQDRGKWVAQIKKDRKVTYLGSHATELEASIARDKAAKRMFGQFAVLNHRVEDKCGD